jgi:hypothetical protein
MTVKGIDPNVIFQGPEMSGAFVGALQTLAVYLRVPQELANLQNEDEESYISLIKPLFALISDINKILEDKGLLKDVELPDAPQEAPILSTED